MGGPAPVRLITSWVVQGDIDRMCRFALPDFRRAFCAGEHFGDDTIQVIEAGNLMLPTGRIMACDPGYLLGSHFDETAYTRTVPPGLYPVSLALLRGYVACARVRFCQAPAVRWEMALRPGWDLATLKPGLHFGYGVDGGTGCFVDEQAVAGLPRGQSAFSEALRHGMGTEGLHRAYRAIVPPALGELFASTLYEFRPPFRSAILDSETGANIICFPSGLGDGCYPSYFGLAVDGNAACLVTDFGLLVRLVMDTLEIPVPVQQHSELTHPGLAAAGIDRAHCEWKPAKGEIAVLFEGARYLQEVRFENRPGLADRSTGFGYGRDETEGQAWYFQLEEPLQPTARVLIEYTLRVEAL